MNKKTTNSPSNGVPKKKNRFVKYLILLWGLFIGFILCIPLLFLAVSKGYLGELPDPRKIENPEFYIASQIVSADGQLLGKFYKENRSPATFDELPTFLTDALVATEDERFESHSGIDFRGVARAISGLGTKGGASTISQQLAKLMFTENRASHFQERLGQKLKEWVLAVQLEKRYTKEEIITMYLNEFDFLYNAIGIKSAARTYFNKSVNKLTVEESALLVGLLKNPALYNPRRNETAALGRRNIVLGQMLKNDKIDDSVYDSVLQIPISLNFTPNSNKTGKATYFREFLKGELTEILQTKGVKKRDGTPYDIELDGLKIYTTIDMRAQENAEKAIEQHLKERQKRFNLEKRWNTKFPFHGKTVGEKTINDIMWNAVKWTDRYKTLVKNGVSNDSIEKIFQTPVDMKIFSWKGSIDTLMSPWDSIRYHKSILQAGLLSMEPQTGFVKAWVGGIDYNHFQYDHVKKGRRQVGSTFKPFVYVTAIAEKHYSPCTRISNAPYRNGTWKLSCGGGEVSLKEALAKSLNCPTARLIERTTPTPVIQLCRDLGITSEMSESDLTIALGTSDISLYEMVGAYSAFANKGIYIKPTVVWRVEDKDGRILYEHKPVAHEVYSEEVAYAMLKILKGSADVPRGTSVRLRSKYGLKNPIAAKTGTTNSNSDAWFMGIVPNLVTGVWVGCEDRAAHFASTGEGQGASNALPAWAYYMKRNYATKDLGISEEDFEELNIPEEERLIDFNCGEYSGYKAFGAPIMNTKTVTTHHEMRVDSVDINYLNQQQKSNDKMTTIEGNDTIIEDVFD